MKMKDEEHENDNLCTIKVKVTKQGKGCKDPNVAGKGSNMEN
jgi:hypothetical protein